MGEMEQLPEQNRLPVSAKLLAGEAFPLENARVGGIHIRPGEVLRVNEYGAYEYIPRELSVFASDKKE